MNNYQIGLVGYFCVILVFGFLFLSKQEESSYRRKDTEGRKRKTHGTGRAELGKIAEESGRAPACSESVWL